MYKVTTTSESVTLYYKNYGADTKAPVIKSVTADFVLMTVTAPATTLMEFSPPLSPRKRLAMRSVHYDSSTKVLLEFSKKFWEDEGISDNYCMLFKVNK